MGVHAKVTVEGSYRKVAPYYQVYRTHCKERWRGRLLVDVFTSEFRDQSIEHYKALITSGGVLVNGVPSISTTKIQNGDVIEHKVHRHEPAVSAEPIAVIHEDDDIVVIDKPSGIPVHPTGRYKYNTVTEILKREMGLVVYPCNRLDKPTSGVMILAKNKTTAKLLSQSLQTHEFQKEYLAKVRGRFPSGTTTVVNYMKSIDRKVSLNGVCSKSDKEAKWSKTVFQLVSYDRRTDTSIVLCFPLTGRTHQIRVHLRTLNHPIANDPIYSNEQVWGGTLAGTGTDYDAVARKLRQLDPSSLNLGDLQRDQTPFEDPSSASNCSLCETDISPPQQDQIWLHALQYTAHDGLRSYRTAMPSWS
ncbi:bifunctional DRAP deaminase/tRNA pseudouridine synthase RIB2 KNAG_0K01080 [Huiozyma naganishii CBS 8797]|uniref:Pseudouridine synthase n=1 Tax=Huiozyma naganishii (strain ATCC MYA-139 / BCRC 22969 / CBS 8797 / KCTC 17520 / NBRC 10181 / NCYC 3082 / Yp74L-3) TaxID=1071383 RepID=J7RRL1_HUIN7|nr:hypothetical protein KNAG_0K01080 [Kazachstania naganishii CBS 8797]CCK72473.1 hypothetical protein KNAG_0K01080 [Kazachstania naganishii CBS 8797]